MKYICLFYLSVATYLIPINSHAQPGNWSYIGPNPYYYGGGPGWFQDITFPDSLHGFAIDEANPRMMITSDGGNSWRFVRTPFASYQSCFISPQIGWISNGVSVAKTQDGGNSWTQQLDTTGMGFQNAYFWSLNFINSQTGFVVGSYFVGKTLDGGNTWTNITPLQIDSNWRVCTFLNADTGWIFSADSTIAKTTNGGQTWEVETAAGTSNFIGAHFYNPSFGIALGQFGQIIKTTNGGSNWNITQSYNGISDISAVKFGTNGLVYALDYQSDSLYISSDSGNMWQHHATPEGMFAVYFNSPQTGYIANTHIYKTTDGGINWNADIPQYPSVGYPITDFGRESANHEVAIRNNESIESTDNGINWTLQSGATLNAIQTVSASCYFLQDFSLGLLRYENGSLTYSNASYNLAYAQSRDSFIVWYQPSSDTLQVLATTNGGNTWNIIFSHYDPNYVYIGEWKSSPNYYMKVASFMNWKVGVVAYINQSYVENEFITLDGGTNWAQPTTVSGDVIASTKVSPDGSLFALRKANALNYALFKWNTSGSQWQFVNYIYDLMTFNPDAISDIGWSSDNILWSCSSPDGGTGNNYIVYSLDNGNSWFQYGLDINGISLLKNMPDGSFICGTGEGDLLQYNGSLNDCRIKGNVFYDFNRDGIFNGNDVMAVSYPVVIQPQGLIVYTDENGTYFSAVDSGSYNVSVQPTFNYNAAPNVLPVVFTSQTGISSGNNFALQPVDTTLQDLFVGVYEDCQSAPGFQHVSYIGCVNNGVTPVHPVLTLIMDPNLSFVSAAPAVTTQHGDTLVWNLATINPLQSTSLTLTTTISLSAQLDETIQNVAILSPIVGDHTPENNIDTSTFYVLGSYDPNFKIAKPNVIAGNETYNPAQLNYTVEFQNTGSAATHFVVVKDALPKGLDAASLRVVASSAPCDFHMETGNVAVFRFNNYALPDSSVDEIASRGFVSFIIKPKAGWLDVDTLFNTADIYFDYNSPVTTNIAKVKVIDPSTEIRPIYGDLNVSVYPNPTSDYIHIQSAADFSAKLFDLSGRPVWESKSLNSAMMFNVTDLSSGLYLLQVIENGKMKSFSMAIVK